jgi:vacuolar-type H+-ATPase subunit F/Vma7
MRELKSVYYGIANFRQGYSENLKTEVKQYLREKHKDLIISLPGHEEPPSLKASTDKWVRRLHRDSYMKNIEYSKFLDKLLTRQILKAHRQLRAT